MVDPSRLLGEVHEAGELLGEGDGGRGAAVDAGGRGVGAGDGGEGGGAGGREDGGPQEGVTG